MNLKEKYQKEVIPAMMKEFGYKNVMAVPKISKVVLNSCFGKEVATKTGAEREKFSKSVGQDMAMISGQKAKIIKSKKSISGFKLRQGIEIAAKVTLRKDKMYDFIERFISLTLPRSRDFKGIPESAVDKKGNFNFGFRENIYFPEVVAEKEKTIFGVEITVVNTASSHAEGVKLLKLMGFPLRLDEKKDKKHS